MNRRHFLKALAVVAGAVSLAPRLAIAATLEEATRPYVIQPSVPTLAAIDATLAQYGQYTKVSDLMVVPAPLSGDDPLSQYGIQGWKIAYVNEILRPQTAAAVLANLTRPSPDRRLSRASF